MRISEMSNEQATQALVRIADPLGRICDDDETIKIIEEYKNMTGIPAIKTIGKLLPKLMTYGLKAHKDDLYEIVGALTFQSKSQVAKSNFLDTIKVVRESYDEVLHDFFTSSAAQIKKSADES